ncbi:MAG TPA: DUF2231 domain-containing protein [Gaiellaceae bacterium]|jgi:uncharacterized membrane protein|nr:DUF2231 domain-containing protein [Gaiellaceae bacterium]
MKLSYLWKGFPGHPLHPPLTDATIGMYTFAAAMALLSRLGVSEANTTTAWWLALIAGLVVTAPTALTGFADWLDISRGTPLWRTATLHLIVMVGATVVFAVAAGAGHADYVDGELSGGSLVLTLIGFGVLTLGGWLGGANVFVHGMRVLNLVDEPTTRAVTPAPYPEKEEAEGGG